MKAILISAVALVSMMLSGGVAAESCGALPIPGDVTPQVKIKLKNISPSQTPVLGPKSAGAEGVNGGFEGGTVIKVDGVFHAFITEMTRGFATRLALWASPDGDHWRRTGTLFASSGDFTGRDRRAALWAAMPVFDEANDVWDLFYVA